MIKFNKTYFKEGTILKYNQGYALIYLQLGELHPDQTFWTGCRVAERFIYKSNGWQGGDYLLDHQWKTGPISPKDLEEYVLGDPEEFKALKDIHSEMKKICDKIKRK